MQNAIDRQRLLRQFGQESAHPVAVLAKCAAGLAILIGIALIGVTVPPDEAVSRAASNPSLDVNEPSASVANLKSTDATVTSMAHEVGIPSRDGIRQSHP